MATRWQRQSAWSIRLYRRLGEAGQPTPLPYAVSRSIVLDVHTGELVERFQGWHGWPLEPGRRDIPMPELLGTYAQEGAAQAACLAHCSAPAEVSPCTAFPVPT